MIRSTRFRGRAGRGARDRTKDADLGRAFGEALACEAKPGCPQDGEQKTHCRGQDPHAPFELVDGGEELLAVVAERFEGDDGAWASTFPTGDGRARDVEAVPQPANADTVHVLSETVVVRAAMLAGPRDAVGSSREDHPAGPQRKRAGRGFLSDIQRDAVAYTFAFGMSWFAAG